MNDPKQPETFTEFMEAQAGPVSQPLPSDEDILAVVFEKEFGDAATRRAIAIARATHPQDFNLFMRVITCIALVYWPPDWGKIDLQDFIESMYVIVKHANFMARIRLSILQAVQPVSSKRPN